jgi:hypothetical protein
VPGPLSADRLRRSASSQRLTGISVAAFDAMLRQLRGPWAAPQSAKGKEGRRIEIGVLEDYQLVILTYCRGYANQEFLGFFYKLEWAVQSRIGNNCQHTAARIEPCFLDPVGRLDRP